VVHSGLSGNVVVGTHSEDEPLLRLATSILFRGHILPIIEAFVGGRQLALPLARHSWHPGT
jgi:hypothetical protein